MADERAASLARINNRAAAMHEIGMPDEQIAFAREKSLGGYRARLHLAFDVLAPARHLILTRVMSAVGKRVERNLVTTRIVDERPGIRMHIFQRGPCRDEMGLRFRRHVKRVDMNRLRTALNEVEAEAEHRPVTVQQSPKQPAQYRRKREVTHFT